MYISPGEGKGYPLQYSGLENSVDCIVHVVAKSRTWLSAFHLSHTHTHTNTHTYIHTHIYIYISCWAVVGKRSKKLQSFSDMSKVMNLHQNRDVNKFTLETALLCKEDRHSRRRGKWPSGRLCTLPTVTELISGIDSSQAKAFVLTGESHSSSHSPYSSSPIPSAPWGQTKSKDCCSAWCCYVAAQSHAEDPVSPGEGAPCPVEEPVPDFRGFSLRI